MIHTKSCKHEKNESQKIKSVSLLI